MTVKGGPKIVSEGLVFHLDAAGAISGKGYNPEGLRVEYLIVGGGGGGGGWSTAGGGGAGGLLQSVTKFSAGTYTVTVGAGGTRGDTGSSRKGSNGGNSQFGASLVVYGGGGGGANTGDLNGLNGGSGGGGFQGNGATGIGGSGVADQGNNGGNGGGGWRSGSGGGAGAAGTPGVGGYGSARGGIGKISRIDFNREYYAGGGASGGCANGDNSGGLGGGGNGGRTNADGTNGASNLGGGGGGGGCYNTRATFGGNGGSGIVIIRYRGKQKATGGDTIVYKNGYTIHTFTSSGSFVLNESVDGLSTNKIVGTLTNMDSSNYTSGNVGYFSFATDEYISLSQTVAGEHRTISVWVYVSQTLFGDATGGQGPIISGADAKTIWLGNFSSATIDEVLQIYDGSRFTFSKGPVNAGWRNLIFRWNGSYYDIFIDSIQKTSFIGATGANTHCILLSNVFSQIGSRTNNNQYFSGDIASVKIYNISLTDRQILDNYSATKGRYGL
jgi:hypothetical protein